MIAAMTQPTGHANHTLNAVLKIAEHAAAIPARNPKSIPRLNTTIHICFAPQKKPSQMILMAGAK